MWSPCGCALPAPMGACTSRSQSAIAAEQEPGVAIESGPALSARQRRLAAIHRAYLASQQTRPSWQAPRAEAPDQLASPAADGASPAQALRLLVWAARLTSLVDGVADADLSRVLEERLDARAKLRLLAAGAEVVLEGLDDGLLRAVRTGTSRPELELLATVAQVVHVHPVVRSLGSARSRVPLPLAVARGLSGNVTVRSMRLIDEQFDDLEGLRLLLGGVKQLESLYAGGEITVINGPYFFEQCLNCAPTLRTLEIGWLICPEGLGDLLAQCRRLTFLRITSPTLDGAGMAALASSISRSRSLKRLELDFRSPPDGEAPLARAIRGCSTLEHLTLPTSCFGRRDWEGSAMADAIARNTSLKSLVVSCPDNCSALTPLVEAIRANRSIQRLDLLVISGMQQTMPPAVAALLAQSTSLEALQCRFPRFDERAIRGFAESLAVNTKLRELRIPFLHVPGPGVAHLVSALERNSVLQVLEIGGPTAMLPTVAPLINALRINSSVTELQTVLRHDAEGLEALFAMLEVNSALRSVDVRAQCDPPVSGFLLAAAIRNNSTLTSATLGMLSVQPGSMDAIADALAANSSLRRLAFRCHGHDVELAHAVARGAARNTSLTELRMGSLQASEPLIEAIGTLIECNSALTALQLGYGWMLERPLTRLSRAIRRSSSLTELSVWRPDIRHNPSVRLLADAIRVHHSLREIPGAVRDLARFPDLDAALSESRRLSDRWWRRRGLVMWMRSLL